MRNAHNPNDASDLPLFHPRVPARVTDPATSQDAAAELAESGALRGLAAMVLRSLVLYVSEHKTPPTARELAYDRAACTHEQAHKRLPELEAAGLVTRGRDRTCAISGHTASTWQPTAAGIEAVAFYGGQR